jgi:hypothetical protein
MEDTTQRPNCREQRLVRRLRCILIGHVVYPADHAGKSLMRRTAEGVEADCDICGKTIRATCGLELCGLVWCRKPNAESIHPELKPRIMSNPDTSTKPATPEQPSPEGLDETACSAWRVPTRKTVFGTQVETGIKHGPVIVLYRATHGWKTGDGRNSHVSLPGQIYTENLQPILDEKPREIVAVCLASGKWVTIWSSKFSEVSFL